MTYFKTEIAFLLLLFELCVLTQDGAQDEELHGYRSAVS